MGQAKPAPNSESGEGEPNLQGLKGIERLSVNLSPEVAAELRAYADRRDISITEAIRRAISTQVWVDKAVEKGSEIIERRSGESDRVLIFLK